MVDIKKKIAEKINDIDLMLNDLEVKKTDDANKQDAKPAIDITGLDVVDVLDSILNQA